MKCGLIVFFLGSVCLYSANYFYSPDGQLTAADYGGAQGMVYSYDNSANLTAAALPTALEQWRLANFGIYFAEGDADNNAYHGGLTNLVRFGVGLSLADPLSLRASTTTTPTNLTIVFWARNDMPNLSIGIDSSTDGGVTWIPVSGPHTSIQTIGAYTQWSADVPYTGTAPDWQMTAILLP